MGNYRKIKSVLFCRVSSLEQSESGYSLDSQEKLLKEYADSKDFKILRTYKITESAAGKQIRKTFKEMLQFVDKNNVPVIVCEKIDRLTRNLKDASEISDWIQADEKREVHFVKENFIVNKNTKAHENLIWDMKVAIARFYTNNLGEEVVKGQKEKIAQGWLPTKPPLGYKTTGESGHKIHVIDDSIAPHIRKMFEIYATGNYSLSTLVKEMYKQGLRNRDGKKAGKSQIHRLLSDPFYYGKMRWKNEIYPAKHKKLVSKELFEDVQKILLRKTSNPTYRKHTPVFKAMIKCGECKGTVTWEIQRKKWYGHCNHYRECSQRKYIRQTSVEEQLFPHFDKVAPKSERVLKWLEGALKESHAGEIRENDLKRESLHRIVTISDKRIEGAYKDKLDGKMPADVCDKAMKDATQEKEDALDTLKILSGERTAYYEAGYAIHELALKAKDIYLSKRASIEDKRLLLSHAFQGHTLSDNRLNPNYTLAFEFLAKWMPKINKYNFEQHANGMNKRQNDTFVSSRPEMLPR